MRVWIYRVLMCALWIGGMCLLIAVLLAMIDGEKNAATKIVPIAL